MAESADDPTLFWVEPEMRGVIPLQRLSHRLAAGPHRALGCLQRHRRYRLQGGHRRLRGAAARPRRHLDQQAHPRSLCRTLRARALPQRRGLAGRRPRRRPLRGEPRARLLRREHVPSRPRRVESGAGASGGAADRRRLRTARHPICDRTSAQLRRRRNSAAPLSHLARQGDRGRARGFHAVIKPASAARKRSRLLRGAP